MGVLEHVDQTPECLSRCAGDKWVKCLRYILGKNLYSENKPVGKSDKTQKRKQTAAEGESAIFGDCLGNPAENNELCLLSNVLWKA